MNRIPKTSAIASALAFACLALAIPPGFGEDQQPPDFDRLLRQAQPNPEILLPAGQGIKGRLLEQGSPAVPQSSAGPVIKQPAASSDGARQSHLSQSVANATTRAYNALILDKVDRIVCKELYSADLVKTAWKPALEQERASILASKNLVELSQSINLALAALKSSHCEFVTSNDEVFYFLHDLFGRWNQKLTVVGDYVGFVAGPPRFAPNQIRYVVNASPASKAGLQVGDQVDAIDGEPYIGQSHFTNKSGRPLKMEIERGGKVIEIKITPIKKNEYLQYVDAIKQSARTYKISGHTIGYVHDWCGGNDAHEALEDVLSGKLHDSDGLILDLRDGYGGNSLEDLDFFYRNPAGYPPFSVKFRNGKTDTASMYYDKPVVAIINDGARSGKELLAFSLKRSGRAVLVGLNTAGAVLAGKLFPLDARTALYLAVGDGTVGGVRLEGTGVAPDIKVDDQLSEAGKHAQQQKAEDELLQLMQKSQPSGDGTAAPAERHAIKIQADR